MPSASYRLSETIWVSEAKGAVTTMTNKYRSVSIEKHRSRNDIFSDKVYDMMKEKHNQLKQSTSDNKPLLFRDHSMFCLSALFNSGTCRVEAACTSLPDDFFLSPSVCSHANVAVVYDVGVVSSFPMLEMEKVETSLSSLLGDVGDMVTVRERVDLAFGIVCAVEYFHEQLRVAHGLISCDTVFVTQQLRAKLLDPSAAFLLTGKLSEHGVSCGGDIKQLVEILLSLLSDTCPAFLFACDRLRDIAVGVDRVERKGDCYSLSEMKDLLHGLQQTAEYHCCPRGRQLVCQNLGE